MQNGAKPVNNGARVVKFASFDGRNGGEHNGVGLVDTSKIFAMQDNFFE